jgi:hypothetical protein
MTGAPVGSALFRGCQGRPIIDQAACKPGSVHRKRPKPLPDGRSFLWDGPCGPPHATNPDGALRRACGAVSHPTPIPIRSCSRRGLPCRTCRQARGGLLPHPFTLTLMTQGGLLSVALSLGFRDPLPRPRAPAACRLPRADVIRRLASVEPGLSSRKRTSQRSPGRLIDRPS